MSFAKKWEAQQKASKTKKKHYAVLYGGRLIEETWAVSAKKAVSNVWWKRYKYGDLFQQTDIRVEDLDVVEI